MNPFKSPTFIARALPPLVFAAVPLAAFLGFVIQPMMGKRLLPIYGGTSGTWLGCMVFFQLALLLGYSWAAWLGRRRTLWQCGATTALALLAVVTFHLPSDQADAPAGLLRVVWRLSLASLPAMVLLFSVSPLLHGWLRRRGEEVPYYLYSVSNAGSLAALLLYPFLIETRMPLFDQTFLWHGCLFVVAGLMAAAGYLVWQSPDHAHGEPAGTANEPLAPGTAARWLGLSALTCMGLLGATYHLSAEMGSNPLAWIGPFGAYLFSFMITFSGRWQRWMTLTTLVWVAISLSGYMVTKGFTATTVNAGVAWWLLSLTASGSFLGNALLHGLRPAQRFDRFYLVLAAGGVLGGLISSLVIPYVLSQPLEFALVSAALLCTGVVWLNGRREPAIIGVTVAVVLSPVLVLGIHQMAREVPEGARLEHHRDLYGHVIVQIDPTSAVLSSDTTKHGTQLLADEAARRRPTLYYTESSGIGRVLEKLQAGHPQLNVGVIGLGAGTLAAYGRKGDTYDFWDIDPKALRVARENFTYVADSAATVNLILRDGRKALEESRTDYDVLVIDAFTGDGIPSHLLTREAIAVYLRRLASRQGLLVVHTSTRYSNLFPVIEATVRTLGRSAVAVATDIGESLPARDWDASHTEYVVVCPPERLRPIVEWFPLEEENGRVKRDVTTIQAPLIYTRLIWSDDRNAAIDTFELGRFLFSH